MTNNISAKKIHPKPESLIVKNFVDMLKVGFQLTDVDEIKEVEKDAFSGAIMISPDYQRDYISDIDRDSSLVESMLVGIPIPPVFLASSRYKDVKVRNVVDGQHRLMAFYRFINNEFALKNLTLRKDLEGKKFKELSYDDRSEIADNKVDAVMFDAFPGKDFELEVFKRYNKGTKPLSNPDIWNAVYSSKYTEYINHFTKKNFDEQTKLASIYNINKMNLAKKSIHEHLYAIFYVLENGINLSLSKTPQITEAFMKEKSLNADSEEYQKKYVDNTDKFEAFNEFLLALGEEVEFPLSKEIYGVSNRNYKFQISIALIFAQIFHKILTLDFDHKKLDLKSFKLAIKELLENSYLEDPSYNASSTNPKMIAELTEKFEIITSGNDAGKFKIIK